MQYFHFTSKAIQKKNIELDPVVRRVIEKFEARVTNVEDPPAKG